jgi:RNA polymerase sigma-B factor
VPRAGGGIDVQMGYPSPAPQGADNQAGLGSHTGRWERGRGADRQTTRALFRRLRLVHDAAARERLILRHARLVTYLAQKFATRGQPLEDLIQVGQIGLIKAVDRYDPARGVEFVTYATPTIIGEIRRYFRDKAWSVHIPRRLRAFNCTLMRSLDRLAQRLGRSPTIAELAQDAGISLETALAALDAGRAYVPASLDAIAYDERDGASSISLLHAIGADDRRLEQIEDRLTLARALRQLPTREQQILRLLYCERLTQGQIARRLGISQMHVSRLRRKALALLRSRIGA